MLIIGIISCLVTLLSSTTITPEVHIFNASTKFFSKSSQEMPQLNRLFVYGTLKRGEPNYNFMTSGENGTAKFVGPATTVQKFPLVIASKYNVPFLLHKEGTGHNIAGEVFDVDNSLLSTLDELEGHPHFYTRVKYDVVIDHEDIKNNGTQTTENCWIYLLKTFNASMLNLTYMSNYSAYGPHGLEYVKRYDRLPVEVYNLEAEIKG